MGAESRLRMSRFARLIPNVEQGRHLVYSNITGAVAAIGDATLALLTSCPVTLTEPFPAAILELKEAGILVPEDCDDYGLFQRRVDLIKRRRELDIIANLTLDCNMVCSYCFERKKPEHMSLETVRRIAEFAETRCVEGEIDKLVLSLFGGEPLLNKPALRELVLASARAVEKHGCHLRLALITNGLLLDEDTIAFLESFDTFLVQVTVDGPKEVHDRRRRPKGGRAGGFETIMGNVMNCVGRLPLTLRVNVDEDNVESLPELFAYWRSVHLNRPGVVVDLQRVDTSTSCNKHYRRTCIQEEHFDARIIPLVLQLRRMGFQTSHKVVRTPRYVHCGANTSRHLAVDPNGDLYTCLTGAGNSDLRVGNLFAGTMFEEAYSRWVNRNPLDIPECRDCDIIGFCGGGCAVQALSKHGDINRPACPSFRFNCTGPMILELWRAERTAEVR